MSLSAIRRPAEGGFLLIEAIVGTAIVALCAGAAFLAIVTVQHQLAVAERRSALTLTAQNMLTDLRAATAYDPAQLAALPGRATEFDFTEPGSDGSPRTLHATVTATRTTPPARTTVLVTVRNALGQSATVQSTLSVEAPAPGSVLAGEEP